MFHRRRTSSLQHASPIIGQQTAARQEYDLVIKRNVVISREKAKNMTTQQKDGQSGTGLSRRLGPVVVECTAIALVLSVLLVVRSTSFLQIGSNRELGFLPKVLYQPAPLHICFIASQFGADLSATDKLFDVNKTVPSMVLSPYYHFFAFSNLKDLKAPGWEVIVKDLGQYTRWITQSRWPKFQAYKEKIVQDTCEVVFYVDGVISPNDVPKEFQAEAQRILKSPVQFAQRLHSDGGGAEAEFGRIKRQKKDIKANIKASLQWLQSQPDYNKNCTLYENNMFGYSIHSQAFQQAANFFWDHYSKEQDSWRGKHRLDAFAYIITALLIFQFD